MVKVGVVKVDIVEVGMVQVGMVEVGVVEMGVVKVGMVEVGVVKLSTMVAFLCNYQKKVAGIYLRACRMNHLPHVIVMCHVNDTTLVTQLI